MAADQAKRLRRLRSAVSKSQAAAAREAGVSKDAWNRMETGEHRINPLALARWGEEHGIVVEYVLSGRLLGLPEDLARLIAALEAREAAGTLQADNQELEAPELAHTSVGKNRHGKAKP